MSEDIDAGSDKGKEEKSFEEKPIDKLEKRINELRELMENDKKIAKDPWDEEKSEKWVFNTMLKKGGELRGVGLTEGDVQTAKEFAQYFLDNNEPVLRAWVEYMGANNKDFLERFNIESNQETLYSEAKKLLEEK
jgi:hypothetical protein